MALTDSWVKKEFAPETVVNIQQQESLLEEMGITRDDADYLRKSALSADEAVAGKQEELDTMRIHKGRKKNWLLYIDRQARMGKVLVGSEVVRRLRTILPQLFVYDGRVRGTWGLAYPVIKHFNFELRRGWEYLGWIYSDWNPEYEIDETDDLECVIGRRQGYRTVLLNNIIRTDGDGKWLLTDRMTIRQNGTGLPLNIVTEEKALEAFGYPTNGPTASNYRKYLWEFRNGRKLSPIAWT
jgi:hypothetical protein